MKHIFDVKIAEKYGVNAAVLLENLGYWIKQNEANETNYYDGTYWTYNSRRAYKELFPYMSERQINTAFQKLIDDGLIITGNYNKIAYDRTLWYALTQKGKCILHFDIMEDFNMSNGNSENVTPIPNINTDGEPIVNTDNKYKEGTKEIDKRYLTIVNNPIEEKLDTVLNKVEQGMQQSLTNNIYNNNIYNNKTPYSPPLGASKKQKKSDEEFDVFWKAYPKKQAKATARKSFDKVDVPVEVLLDAIREQSQTEQWSKDKGKYIPMPSTWLNQRRWEDVIKVEISPVVEEEDYSKLDVTEVTLEDVRIARDPVLSLTKPKGWVAKVLEYAPMFDAYYKKV